MTDIEKMKLVCAKDQLARGAVILEGLDSAVIGLSDCGRLVYSEKETIKDGAAPYADAGGCTGLD